MSRLDNYLASLRAASAVEGTALDIEAAYLRSLGHTGTLLDMRAAYADAHGWDITRWHDHVAESGFGVTFSVFANSAMADDSGDGLTEGTAKKTLAAAMALVSAGQALGLARGSTWREQITPAVNMTIGTVGTGAMPVIDGADVATGWARHDPAGLPNVWNVSWTRTGPITGNDDLGVWVDGVRPRIATTLADLNTNGGWFATDYRALTTTVYVHSLVDPNTDGKLREITRRNHAIGWHPSVTSSTATVTLAGPLETKRAVNHYNGIAAGPGSVEDVLIRDGHIHHIVTSATHTTNVVATEIRSNLTIPGVPFVAYQPDGSAFSHTFNYCLALFPGGADRLVDANAFYAHDSSTGVMGMTLNGCAVRGIDGPSMASRPTATQTITGFYAEDPYNFAIDINGFTTTINASMVFDTLASPKGGGNVGLRNSNVAGAHTITNHASYTLLGSSVVDAIGAGSTTMTNCAFVARGGANITDTDAAINYCVFDAEGRSLHNAGVGYTGNHNVFYFRTLGDHPWIHWNGVLYTNLGSFQAASGQDANSVYLLDVDQTSGNANAFWLGVSLGTGGPEVGDFRINPNAKVYNGAGVSRFGTFTDGVALTLAGPQQHWDFDTRALVAGPPSSRPTLPSTVADCRLAVEGTWSY